MLKYFSSSQIAPIELETVIQLHPAVLEVAVVGKPDSEFGDLATAFIVKQPNYEVSAQDIIDFLKEEVSMYLNSFPQVDLGPF